MRERARRRRHISGALFRVSFEQKVNASPSFSLKKSVQSVLSFRRAEDKREKMMDVNDGDVLDISLGLIKERRRFFFVLFRVLFLREFFLLFLSAFFFLEHFFLSFFLSFIPCVRARACALCVISLRLERRAEREHDFKGVLFSRILCIRHREAAQKQPRGDFCFSKSIGKRFNRDERLGDDDGQRVRVERTRGARSGG